MDSAGIDTVHLYFAGGRLSLAELSAARLDGHLTELGDAYIPADAVETGALRARSLRPLLGDVLAATGLSAAWVHGASAFAPDRHRVQRAVPRRLHHVISRRLEYHDQPLPDGDLLRVGGVWVTTRSRTLSDLLRDGRPTCLQAAERMLRLNLVTVEDGLAWLDRAGPIHNKRLAQRTLTRWQRHHPGTQTSPAVTS